MGIISWGASDFFNLINREFHSTCPVFYTCVYTFTAATHMLLSQAANHILIRQTAVFFLLSHGTVNASWFCNVLSA